LEARSPDPTTATANCAKSLGSLKRLIQRFGDPLHVGLNRVGERAAHSPGHTKIESNLVARDQSAGRDARRVRTMIVVLVGNLRSNILVMEPAQNRHGERLTNRLDGARDRCVLLQ